MISNRIDRIIKQTSMNYLTNLIVYFVSTPSVYTLPGTWEPQPDVSFDPTLFVIYAAVLLVAAAILSVLIKKKRKRI